MSIISWITPVACKKNPFLTLKVKKAAVKIIPCGWTAGRMEIYNFLCLCTRWSRSHPVLSCIAQQKTEKFKLPTALKGLSPSWPADAHWLPCPHPRLMPLLCHWTPQWAAWLYVTQTRDLLSWWVPAAFNVCGAVEPNVFNPHVCEMFLQSWPVWQFNELMSTSCLFTVKAMCNL